MNLRDNRGSILLETVLVLPIFVLIVFFVIQMTFVWTAKQMTYYAAYCGARATLVYNPADYGATKQGDGSWKTGGPVRSGVVHQAACAVLSWISWSIGGVDLSGGSNMAYSSSSGLNELYNFRIGTYSIPLSSNIRNQVTVEVSEFESIGSDGKSGGGAASIDEQFPAATVRVRFRFPLFIPLGGPVVAYFFGANQGGISTTGKDGSGAIGVGGFTATNGAEVHSQLQSSGNYTESGNWKYYSIVLEESCTMAKPYKTDTYPRAGN